MKIRRPVQLSLATAILCFGVSCKNRNKVGDAGDMAGAAAYGGVDGSGYRGNGAPGNGGAGYGGNYSGYGSGSDIALPNRRGGSSFYNASKGQFAPIYFQFDSFQVGGAEMAKLQAAASYARENGKDLIVAGFADAVGTEEYNRGLGDRRALSVRSALLQSGVKSSQIQTVSFGEEMLADQANPTSGRNRRVEFGVVR